MTKYNHCPKCGKSLGWKSFFKFWTRPNCPTCEQNQL